MPAKYAPLTAYLRAQSGERVTLTFVEIEAIIGAPLPLTARRVGWWANVPRWSHARAWLAAGWQMVWTDVWGGRVTFARQPPRRGDAPPVR